MLALRCEDSLSQLSHSPSGEREKSSSENTPRGNGPEIEGIDLKAIVSGDGGDYVNSVTISVDKRITLPSSEYFIFFWIIIASIVICHAGMNLTLFGPFIIINIVELNCRRSILQRGVSHRLFFHFFS
jgi:hypothetical protein